jgi:drug/metabolite transporter (DMT)-like permease
MFWAVSSSVFTLASRQVGSVILNRLRLVLAILWLLLAHALLRQPLPFQAGNERLLWLSLSGIVGLVLGDAFLFQAFIWIGPRLSMLLMALSPAMAVLLAWLFLGEVLTAVQIVGILVTLTGIGWVVLERNSQARLNRIDEKHYLPGILCGLGAAAGQAIGLILAKEGTRGGFSALSATLVRMIAATVVLWIYTLARGQAAETYQRIAAQPNVLWLGLAGSFFGPFLGVTFSLIAIQFSEVGIASTLMSITPIILLPIGYFFFKDKFGWQAILGTLIAMAGVALLFLV